MPGDNVSHKPGVLKQANKTHKTGRHRSKGAIEAAKKGKVSIKTVSVKDKLAVRKEHRRNKMNQMRKNRRAETLSQYRRLRGGGSLPFLICIVPMHMEIDPKSALAILENCDDSAVIDKDRTYVTYVYLPQFKQYFGFVIPPKGIGNETIVMDLLKVCDVTLLLVSAETDEPVDEWGSRINNAMSAQGIPTPLMAIMDLHSITPNRRRQTKTLIQDYMSRYLPNEKCLPLSTNQDGLDVMRRIHGKKKTLLHNKENRPHLYAEDVEFRKNDLIDDVEQTGTLKISGYLRGIPLDVNGLVHITDLGDFQMSHIEQAVRFSSKTNGADERKIIAVADSTKQTPLQFENPPNPIDEMFEDDIPDDVSMNGSEPEDDSTVIATTSNKTKKENQKKFVKRVPKGYSSYQAAWIPSEETGKDGDDVDSSSEDDVASDGAYMSCEDEILSENDTFEDTNNDAADDDDDDDDVTKHSEASANAAAKDEKYDMEIDLFEERETLKKIKNAREDEKFPDEIDTPLNVAARDRFRKYRGLESFRTSVWDPNENLPVDYSRIYQFKNFDRTKRRILKQSKETVAGVSPGLYITIYVKDIPLSKWEAFVDKRGTRAIVVYGLLPHEHQMAVMTVVLKRTPNFDFPIESKERLIMQCGYRRFAVNPIFSQHTNGDKHKYERYFRPHTIACATFYAPIQFPPASVIAFKENPNGTLALVARGSILSCNPNRIVLKRYALSGHPMRINRKSATIRYMFHNKEDVEYFKPIKLRTRCGRVGHIKESLGTHGHMKCVFDGQLNSYDTVFMYLYKRVFPKWTYTDFLIKPKVTSNPSELVKADADAGADVAKSVKSKQESMNLD